VSHWQRIQRASEGSLVDTVALSLYAPTIPIKYRRKVFSLFLEALQDIESISQGLGSQQASYAVLTMKILNGIGDCFDYVEKDKVIAKALAKDWEMVARWVRRFCDNFKSVQEPYHGAPLITYEAWYRGLVRTLLITNASSQYAYQMWSVSDARHAMYQLWLLDAPDPLLHFVPICTDVLKLIILHQNQFGADFIVMARLVKATKSGNSDDMRDYAYIVLAMMSSPLLSMRSIQLRDDPHRQPEFRLLAKLSRAV